MRSRNNHDATESKFETFGDNSPANAWQSWVEEHTTPTERQSTSRSLPKKKTQTITKTTYIPAKEHLEKILPFPSLCFCKKPAYRSYTLEFGPVLECGNYQVDLDNNLVKTKYICGFHVHEMSWEKLQNRIILEEEIIADHPELRACPLYNFTFCAMFHLTNDYLNIPPSTPTCFCNEPVVVKENKNLLPGNSKVIELVCKNSDIEGVKPKCSWILRAKEVAYPRPKICLHQRVNQDEYERLRKAKTMPINSQNKSFSDGHKHNLLSTLMLSNGSKTSEPTILPSGSRAPEMTNYNLKIGNESLRGLKPLESSSLMIRNESPVDEISSEMSSFDSASENRSPRYRSLLVPTSVIAKKSTSSRNSLMLGQSPVEEDTIEQEKTIRLNNKIEELKTYIKVYKQRNDEIQSLYRKTKTESENCQLITYRYKHELEEETVLRLNSQKRLAILEMDVVKLIAEKEELTQKLNSITIDEPREEGKCIVCFHKAIEYALVPCFHFAYCRTCSSRLNECAICRQPSTGVRKIFIC
ncbi:hypothetical protein CU098_008179 [Rhizopus stolonifer]|uniref:RING-type domain-containing protein n=1 Tax=Rhizopus stolonifer TaxID=4846 RepID=A0A367JE67_RHIST|nr:hypothetical protein CU098_008179 [Rhizopus stolonifer]